MSAVTPSTYFVIANILAGVFNYLFQVIVAHRLSSVAYGQLMSWIAYVSIGMTLGLMAQMSSNFFPSRHLKPASLIVAVLTVIGLGFSFTSPSLVLLGSLAIGYSVGFGWLNGQYQARHVFTTMGTAALLSSFTKLLALFSGRNDEMIYYLGFTIGSAYGALFLALMCFRLSKTTDVVVKGTFRENASAAVLLSFATMLIPQFDLIVINNTQSAEVIGEFARVGLIYRAVFFLVLIFAQLLLPKQIQTRDYNVTTKRHLFMALIAILPLAMVAAAIGPWVLNMLLGFDISHLRIWIFLSCVHVCLLTLIFLFIQKHTAMRENRVALKFFAVMAAVFAIGYFTKLPIDRYLTIAIIFHAAIVIQHLLRHR